MDGKAKKMEELGKKHLQKAKEEEKTTKYKEKEVMEMQRIEMELLERIAKAQVPPLPLFKSFTFLLCCLKQVFYLKPRYC